MSDQQPPAYGQQPGQHPYQPLPPTSGKATAAMILGIGGLVLCPFVLSIPAWILGSQAKNEIDASQGQLGGRGQAQAGFILGIIGTVIIPVIAALIVAVVFIFGSAIEDAFEDTCETVAQPSAEYTNC